MSVAQMKSLTKKWNFGDGGMAELHNNPLLSGNKNGVIFWPLLSSGNKCNQSAWALSKKKESREIIYTYSIYFFIFLLSYTMMLLE